MKKFFYKTDIDITHDKEMFEYLKGHFQYSTCNAWNCLKSVANNVKLHSLNLEGDYWQAYRALQLYGYDVISAIIEEWEAQHPGYTVGFNGRSSGYLVLYNDGNIFNVLPEYITCYTYDEYKEYCKENYGGVVAARPYLVELTKLVRDFDKLCDELRDYVNSLSKEDFVENAMTLALEDFNSTFNDELELLGIAQPEAIDDYRIKLDEKFNNYKSLRLCLCEILVKYDLDYAINSESNTIDILEEKY